ncbi:uncharacterized GPI-anchored protein At1g61900-like [Hibiscus syriacus]|uniref:uncharacterized GPI-anchored protein At1g61900-like n=1 Tax=Hibiscus syriacus TaxID=106335 RepID=UPI0019228DAE|nr:uncharacterized GPI-anchored protein At1g61900-like [Hibiscus syriacus]
MATEELGYKRSVVAFEVSGCHMLLWRQQFMYSVTTFVGPKVNLSDIFLARLQQWIFCINDCKTVVLLCLASKLDPYRAKEVLRGLTNCNVNKVCPFVFPSMRHVANTCGNGISNPTTCCDAMGNYVSHLQKQTLVLQALHCATSLGSKLQKYITTKDVYSLRHIILKDFSLQGWFLSGCLLPSLPSDETFDKFSGISFICDLNDNIPAPWPNPSLLPASSCNKTVRIPALPAATKAQSGLYNEYVAIYLLIASSMTMMMLLQF